MSDVNLFRPGTQLPVSEEAAKKYAETKEKNLQILEETANVKTPNYKKYKNTMPSCNYLFKDGTVAIFIMGEYLTNNPTKIAELDKEVLHNHPHIWIDAKDDTVAPEDLNPETALRNKYFKQFQEEQTKATADRDMGTSEQAKTLNASNSKDMAAVTANGAGALGSVPTSVLNAINNQSTSLPPMK